MALYKVIGVLALLTVLTQESYSQADVCGRPPFNTRIVGGQEAPNGDWPWMASLHKSGSHNCGGVLINNVYVLTAAHCFSSATNLVVYLGRQSQQGPNPNEVSRTVTQLINHPDYNSVTNENDISLLKLSSAVSFTNYIVPVCLAAPGSTFHAGTDSWVTGWGNIGDGVSLPPPQNLMEVEVPIVGNRQCNCDYGVGRITDNMICAGFQAGGKDSCQGDSGGPLVIKQGSVWVLSGIVSFGQGCAQPNFPGVYTRVSKYQSWINNHILSQRPGYVTFTSTGTDSDLSVTCPGLPSPSATSPPTSTLHPTTTPKPVVCGQAPMNSRILGGSSVSTAGMWPWMASLQKNGNHVCGGTLVAVDSVLSNANCFSSSPKPSEWTVVLGRLKQNGSNPFEVTLKVTNITLSNQTGSNVAVLQLESKPTLSNYIQPICMDNGRTFAVGSTCWAAGWSSGRGGEEQVLQEFQTSVQSCGNSSSDDTICTTSFTVEQGDSGGPLMCKMDGSWLQAAVLLANISTRLTKTSVKSFTKLSRFQTFLAQSVGFLSGATTTNSPSTSSTSTNSPSTSSISSTSTNSPSTSSTSTNSPSTSSISSTSTNSPSTSSTSTNSPSTSNISSTSTNSPSTSSTSTNSISSTSTNSPSISSTSASSTSTNSPSTSSISRTSTNSPSTSSTSISQCFNCVVCGQAPMNSRILGGSSVSTAGMWPWMASLQKNGNHVCGGTLVAVDSVLSNANCFSSSPKPSEWTVVLGRLKQNGSNPFEVTLKVTNITLSNQTGSNVAVLQLESKPTLSNYIQPICMDNGRTFAVGSMCWAAGWSSGRGGEEQVLQEFQTSVQSCGNTSSDDTICTTSFTVEQGDSGGPLMCKMDGSWFQAAVLLADNSTRLTKTSVKSFTKLSHFQTFLAKSVGFLSGATTTNSTSTSTSSTSTSSTSTNSPRTSSTSSTSSTNTTNTNTTVPPMTTSGGTPAYHPLFLFFHLLVLPLLLRLFL